jgi:hypothetical protein
MNRHSFKIEKGIPLPPRQHAGTGEPKYPFRDLAVGDSFVIDKAINRYGGIALYYRRTLGHVYRARKIDEKSCRIWRIA